MYYLEKGIKKLFLMATAYFFMLTFITFNIEI